LGGCVWRPVRLGVICLFLFCGGCIYNLDFIILGYFFSALPDVWVKFVGMTWLKDLDVYRPYSDSLYFSSASLARQTEKLAREIWAPSGLSPSHAHLLWVIMNTEYRYPTIFSKSLSLSKSTVTRLLEKLEQDGFVTRDIYERLTVVNPTDKAWKLLPMLMACERTFAEHCNRLLGKKEAACLACAMDEAADKLRAREGCA